MAMSGDYVISESDRQALMRQMTYYRDLIGWAQKVVEQLATDDEQLGRLAMGVSLHRSALAGVSSINMRRLEDVAPSAEPVVLPDFPVPSDFIPQEGAAVPKEESDGND